MILKGRDSNAIVHIATDEKFIDAAYDIFELAYPHKNQFLILSNQGSSDIRYLSEDKIYYFIDLATDFIKEVEEFSKEACLIVFHGMTYHQALLVKEIKKKNKKYLWTVFGAEVYNNEKIFRYGSVGKKTYKEFVFNFKKWAKDVFRPYYYLIVKAKDEPKKVILDSFPKMDYVGILYKEELDNYLSLGIVKPEVKHIKFTYYPLDIVLNSQSRFVNADNILFGNSASYTNNHLEAIELLKNLDLKHHKIVTPLSYGNKYYADKIIKYGNEILGSNFESLTEFLKLSEYQKVLQSCGIVIMNHYRQQAVGNVVNAIYLGAKVYLSNKNTLYRYLKRIGCHIFSIEEDLVPENESVFELLPLSKMIDNRQKIKKELSLERIISNLQQTLDHLIL